MNLDEQLRWFESLELETVKSSWGTHLKQTLSGIVGIHGENEPTEVVSTFEGPRFERPRTILFDDAITVGELVYYKNRQEMDEREATIEQFKVFFNEFYAAALLASILFDDAEANYPWEFFADFSRHFWDEVRHSEFGAIRLRALGVEPDRVNPILFEESEGLPILHRIAYLTRGLEAFFMPRKPSAWLSMNKAETRAVSCSPIRTGRTKSTTCAMAPGGATTFLKTITGKSRT